LAVVIDLISWRLLGKDIPVESLRTGDSLLTQAAIVEHSCRTNEWLAGVVLFLTRSFSEEVDW
jgi:hypothetical protein